MAEDKGNFSKAGDCTPKLFSMLPNTDGKQYIMRDIALLIPCAIYVKHWNGFYQLR